MVHRTDRQPTQRRGDPKRIGDLLGGILKRIGTKAERRDLREALRSCLRADEVECCSVLGFRSGRLTIEVCSAPLYAELRGFRAEDLRSAMNERLENRKIARIEFRMGESGSKPANG